MSRLLTTDGLLFADDAPAADAVGAASTPTTRRRSSRLAMCVLGSGSGGNASVLRRGDDLVMIDLGFGPRTIAARLHEAGVGLDRVRAICLTHLDQDHFRPHWIPTLLGWQIPVYVHHFHREAFRALPRGEQMIDAGLLRCFDGEPFRPVRGVTVSPIRLAHDQKGTSGFLLESCGRRIGYATDLGHVPESLVDHFAGVDLIAIESNYDPPMQLKSPRPAFLKRRIMGGKGHLSNEEAFAAVQRIVRRSPPDRPQHVVLLHRSAQCNCPRIVKEVFARDPALSRRVCLTEQRRRSRWFTLRPRKQVDAAQRWLF